MQPKFTENFGNYSYSIELPDSLKEANDDRLFPMRSEEQIPDLSGAGQEWAAIEKFLAYQGPEVQWASGDRLWVPYHDLERLRPPDDYFEALGVDLSEASPGDDPQVSLEHINFFPSAPQPTHIQVLGLIGCLPTPPAQLGTPAPRQPFTLVSAAATNHPHVLALCHHSVAFVMPRITRILSGGTTKKTCCPSTSDNSSSTSCTTRRCG